MAFWIHKAARMYPDRLALEGPERVLTYAELSREAIGAAGGLRALGVEPGGAPVALELPPGEEYVIPLHACILAGVPHLEEAYRVGEEVLPLLRGHDIRHDSPLSTSKGSI